MTHSTVAAYLQTDTSALHNLLFKFRQLQTWNNWLRNCLSEEDILLTHCRIVGLDKSSLIIIADNSHWATRLRFFIPSLINKLKNYEDFKNVQAICCKVRPLYIKSSQKKKRPPLAISKLTEEIVQETANKIKHKKLQAILLKISGSPPS